MVAEYQPLYTIREVAKILKTNPNFVYNEIASGRLTAILLGSKKVRGKDLEKYINSRPEMDPEKGEQGD